MTLSVDLPPKDPSRPRLVHLATTDMSLDWLLGAQLRAFADAGYEVIGMSAAGAHVANLAEMGIAHVPVPAFTRSNNPLHDVRAFWQLLVLLRRVKPDILHTHNPKPGILGRIAGWLTHVPLVVNTQHGLYAQPTDRRRRRWPVYAAERFAAAFSDAELVQSPEDVETLVNVLRVPSARVTWLGNGIDLQRFSPKAVPAGTRKQLRDDWGIADGEVVCGVVGRLVREKGIGEVLEAAHILRSSGSPARFVIIGPADTDKADAISPASISQAAVDGVVFAGQRTDMPECYAAMDIFVTASWREGFPRAAMEAAAMGLPTVATDIRGNRQVVADGATGVLVPVRDSAALAAAVAAVCASDEFDRRQITLLARKLFDQRRLIDITLATYRKLPWSAGSQSAGPAPQ